MKSVQGYLVGVVCHFPLTEEEMLIEVVTKTSNCTYAPLSYVLPVSNNALGLP